MRLEADARLTGCRELGSTAWRDRGLTPVTTRHFGLWQRLPGHTACRHLPPLAGVRCRAAASGHARATLPRHRFARRLARVGRAVPRAAVDDGRWPGHRPVGVDGAGGSMPATPACAEACGQPTEPRPGCGVPVARLLGRCHAGTGVLLTLGVAPRLPHDLARGQAVQPSGQAGDVRVADRGLGSDAPLALRVPAGVPAVRRVGVRPLVEVTPGRPLVQPSGRRPAAVNGLPRSRWRTAVGVDDPLVAWLPPKTGPAWRPRETGAALPDAGVRRAGRYRMGTPGVRTRAITLVPTRLDAEAYGVSARAERYRPRGPVETARAQLKTTRQRDVWPCNTLPGVLKARTMCAIVSHLVRLVRRPSATLHHTAVERISCVEALRWRSAPRPGLPCVALMVIPGRPQRVEPRVQKRPPKRVPFMITPRQALRQQVVQQERSG